MTKATRRFIVAGALFFGGVFTLAAATEPDSGPDPERPADVGAYDHDQLQRDAQMTQTMSAPGANTGAQQHRGDDQLRHSSNPAFLGDLEAHQADIDRMLARPGR